MQEVTRAIQDLPLESWIPILIVVVLGAAMWAAGRRLLRPAFAGLGLLAGAGAGWLLADAVNFGVPAWVIAVCGGLLVGSLAVLAYKATIAGGLALVLAVAAGLGVWSLAPPADRVPVTSMEALASPEPTAVGRTASAIDDLDEWLGSLRDGETVPAAPALPDATPTTDGFDLAAPLEEHLDTARGLADEIVAQAKVHWNGTAPDVRNRVLGASILGGLIGFLMGTLASTLSASIVTAFGGSMAWMLGGWTALSRLELPAGGWVPDSPNAWLTWWVILSVIGLLIQWTSRPKRADKPA